MNKTIRNRNFKKLDQFKKNPDYERIKNVYLTNEKFSIASARKLLNLVKYTIKGEIKKASIKNKTKLDQELKKYEKPKIKEYNIENTNDVRLLNESLKFIDTNNTDNEKGDIIIGGYKKLSKLLNQIDKTKEYIQLTVYGELVKYDDGEENFLHDLTFTKIYKIFNLEEKTGGAQTKKEYKGTLYSLLGEFGYDFSDCTAEFFIIQKIHPQQYNHAFKNGHINCFFNSISQQLNKGQRKNNNEKTINSRIEKINKLNKQYFESGVTINDIPHIENILNVSIDIFNKADQQIYKGNTTNKGQKMKLKTPYINHISEYIEEKSDLKEKEKTMIDIDINDHYNKNSSNYKYYKTNSDGKKYFYYDETNIYYEPYKINDIIKNKDDIYIYNDLTYNQKIFIDENNLMDNIISSSRDPELFEFINNSIHHLNKFTNKSLLMNDDEIKFLDCSKKIRNKLYTNVNEFVKLPEIKKVISLLDKDINIDNNDDEIIQLDVQQQIKKKENNKYGLNLYTIDNNKCFIGFTNENTPAGKIYKNVGVPTNKFNFYKTTEGINQESLNNILNSSNISFMHIKPIFKNETIKNIIISKKNNKELDEFIFTSFFIKYLLDNDLIEKDFKIKAIATATGKQELIINDDIINNKFYNEIIGSMSSKIDYKTFKFEVRSEIEIQDILFYKDLENNEDQEIFIKDNEITIRTKKDDISNRGHIASVILSYALINIIDVLKDIDYNNLVQVTADAITSLQPINATISTKIGEWKEQIKEYIMTDDYNHYINIKDLKNDYNNCLPFTTQKQNYRQYNFIYGEAGTGKTSQFIKPFKTDERIYNCLFLVPSNCLLNELKKDNDININTYQGFIMAFKSSNEQHIKDRKKFLKYTNILLDETTMNNDQEIKTIFEITNQYNYNLFMIGDYNLKNKESFQLMPVDGESWIDSDLIDKLDKNKCFYKHMIQNHRQNNDKQFYNFLNNIRGKSNEYIKKLILNDENIKKITYDETINDYNINDKILSSVNKFIDAINNDIYKLKNDDIKIMYLTTTTKYAKNETAIIKASEYNIKKHKLGYAQSAHTAQGLTFTDKIYININNLFTDNILYVMLTRAKRMDQIIIIK